MPGKPLPNPASLGVRLAPLAKFDDRDFDLPTPPYEAKHKVKLFKTLLIFFASVIMVSDANLKDPKEQFKMIHT